MLLVGAAADLRGCTVLATLATMSEPLFCYCLQIADREFLIQVAHDGIIYWDDYKMRHRLRGTSDRHLEIQIALGDDRARERLVTEMDEFTVAVPLPPEMLARFREAATMLAEDRWTSADEEKLDTVVISFFWSEVNPRLKYPFDPR